MDRAEKSELITTLNAVFKEGGTVVVAHYTGLSVKDMTALRARMRDAGASVKVSKNRLAKLAVQGTDAAGIADLFRGQTVVAYSKDPVAAAKAAVDFAKTNEKLVILGGAMGASSLNPEGIKALAELPSLDELRAKLLGMLATPATRIAQIVSAPAAQVARVVGAYANKEQQAA